tara:strand:+ start:166558 stop:167010 length:453 start_codon:yes stop_codon:yes gene_type:complete
MKLLKSGKGILALIVLLVVAVIGIKVAFFGVWAGYSDGQRVGTLHQFTQKGVYRIGKGELLINDFGVSGGGKGATTIGNNWTFNVSDDELIEACRNSIDKRIIVEYRQWWRSPWYMTTDYEVILIRDADTNEIIAPKRTGTDGSLPASEP